MPFEAETPVSRYLEVILAYENDYKKWLARVEKIIKRYRDDNRSASGNDTAKFNILWANVQTLKSATYSRMPKADVSRRFSDTDPVGRVASLILERALDYEIEHFPDFRSAMTHCVTDRFLGGRGTTWIRYDPHVIAQEIQITEDIDSEDEPEELPEQIEYECSPTDYVHWKDFGHTPARVWEEVPQVWRWVYLDKEAVARRFPGFEERIEFDSSPDTLNRYTQKDQIKDKAKICELWDKETQKVYWFCKNYAQILDERDDPLDLEGFFPCPKPLYATTTSDSLVPVPDFVLYQDQANELDILSDRIDGLVKALRVRGVYDASQPALQRLLTEGDNNTLIGTDKWAQFSEKGGLKGSIDLLPLDTLATALLQCYQARQDIKGQIYEITGISDIIRGETAASETATAQQIKGQYAGLRLRSMQEEVALFASELLRLKAQVVCGQFQDQTILKYAAVEQLSPSDQQLVTQAMQLIRSEPLRSFRIEVNADSLVQIDENQNKQDRLEFLNAFSNFMREAIPAGQQVPEMAPMLMEIIRYGVSGFKQAKTIEGTIDTALEQLAQKAAQPKPPSPEQMKLQQQAQSEEAQRQADIQMEQAKGQALVQIEQMKAQMEDKRAQGEQQLKLQMAQMEESFNRWEAKLKADTTILTAQISAGKDVTIPDRMAEDAVAMDLVAAMRDGIGQITQHIQNSHGALADQHEQALSAVASAIGQAHGPKKVIRGPDGLATAIVPANPPQPMAPMSTGDMLPPTVLTTVQHGFQQLFQQNQQIGQAIQSLAAAIHKSAGPKRIVRGKDGRAIGLEPVQMQ